MKKVYVDNSATSFPKAPGVSDVIKDFLDNVGCNVNRGGYADSYDVAMEILDARRAIAELFRMPNTQGVIFTSGVTASLNMLLQGFLDVGDHVITTSMEHNAVMRPLHLLGKRGVAYDVARCDAKGMLDPADIARLVRKETKAVVMTQASNVCGTILPVEAVSQLCNQHGLRLIVDAAQAAGVLDIDVQGIDALAFAGHKGLLGPQGVGGLVIKPDFAEEVAPLLVGGTGSQSHEIEQPGFLPDKFEPGTMNIPGILGLKVAVEYVQATGVEAIREKELALTDAFLQLIREIDGIELVGSEGLSDRVASVSLNFPESDNAAISAALDQEYGIMTRCGLHCAPFAHKTLNTYPHGTVRFSFGHLNTIAEIEYITQAIRDTLREG